MFWADDDNFDFIHVINVYGFNSPKEISGLAISISSNPSSKVYQHQSYDIPSTSKPIRDITDDSITFYNSAIGDRHVWYYAIK